MTQRISNRTSRKIARFAAVICICAIALDISFIIYEFLNKQTSSPFQSIPSIANSTVALISLCISLITHKAEEKADPRDLVRRINRSRLGPLRDEIDAALFHHRSSLIDVSLGLLRGSSIRPPDASMRFLAIDEVFTRTPHGRMLVTGSPGSGKSLLSLHFCRCISLKKDEDEIMTPVIIPAQTWDQRTPNLDDWVVSQSAVLLDVDRSLSRTLIDEDLILPIIDGLDEMDPFPGDLSRAHSLIEALNNWPRAFLLTCRHDIWQSLETSGCYLEDSCRVRLESPTSRQVAEYLDYRNRSSGKQIVSISVIREITRTLGRRLSTPFDLALIGSLLGSRESIDPLIQKLRAGYSSRDVEAELLKSFIEARARWYPVNASTETFRPSARHAERSRHYSVDNVLKWSCSLAVFLRDTGGKRILGKSMPMTAISIERLWPISGIVAPRITDMTITCVLWVPLLSFLGVLMETRGDSAASIAGIIGSSAMLPLSSILANRTWVHPSKIVFRRLLQPRRLFRLGIGVALAIIIAGIGGIDINPLYTVYYSGAFALFFGFGIATAVRDNIDLPSLAITGFLIGMLGMILTRIAIIPTYYPMLSLASGMVGAAISLVAGVKVGIYTASRRGGGGLDTIPAGMPTPLARLRGDFQTGLIAGLLVAVTGVIICFINQWPVKSTWDQMILCLLAGVAAGPGYAAATWRRHLAMLICSKGKLPFRLAQFLTWAHTVGLLRIVGRSYEFRHRRIQDWLAR